jgi:predicted acetyltransferase
MLPRLDVTPARPGEKPLLENLLDLYMHDFSEFVPLDVGDDGRFGYPGLASYWSEPGHHAFLARLECKLAGFALVTRSEDPAGNGEVWDMAEFFVLRGYRRRGVGVNLAQKVWKLCPGKWQVRVRLNNLPAQSFWESAVGKFAGVPAQSLDYSVEGVLWRSFSFRSPG